MRRFSLLFLLACACLAQQCDFSCDGACAQSGEFTDNVPLSNGLTYTFDVGDAEVKAIGKWIRFDGDNSIYKLTTSGDIGSARKVIVGLDSCPAQGTSVITGLKFSSVDDNAQAKFFVEPMHAIDIFVGAEVSEGSQPSGTINFGTTRLTPDPHFNCSLAEEVTLPFETDDTLENVIASYVSCHAEPAQGHWYHFKGTGGYVLASTCYEDNEVETFLDVYSSCEDGSECIDTDGSSCDVGGSILFQTGSDVDYYIFAGSASGASGKFHLTIEEKSSSCKNFECEAAKKIDALPYKDTANTRLCPDSKATCLEKNMHGVWYQFEAPETGKYLINTCNSSARDGADTILELHEGCGVAPEGKCLEYNDDFCGRRSAIIAELERDHTYQVLVTGYNSHIAGVDYTFGVEKIPANRKNDECLFAQEITDFPVSVTGNTADMTGATTTFTCLNEDPKPRHGAWFRYRSSGDYILRFSTCSAGNKLKGDIEVYRSCQNICAGVGTYIKEDGCATVLVPTEHDQVFSIFVTPTADAADDFFNLTISEYPPTKYATCKTAREVQKTELPFRHKDSTYGGAESWSACFEQYAAAEWFHFKGTGKTMVATTCGETTAIDTVLELYDACPEEGTSDHCIKKNIDYEGCSTRSLIEFDSVDGQDYYLLARGNAQEKGVIEVRIYEATVPVNSKCDSAIHMSLGNKTNGIIQFASISGGSCSAGVDRRGGWYKFEGTGKHMVADTCNDGTNFEAEVEVYKSCDTNTGKGSSCYARSTAGTCVGGSSISFATDKGKTYYVYVSAPAYGTSVDNSYFLLDLHELKQHSSSGKNNGGLGGVGIALIILVCLLGAALIAFAVFYIVQRRKNNLPGSRSYQSADDIDSVPVSSDTSAQERIPEDAELDSPSESKRGETSATL